MLALSALGWPRSWSSVERIRQAQYQNRAAQTDFRTLVSHLPGPAVVFVRYGPTHNFHASLITNVADLRTAPVWVVYDRAAENTELLSRVPSRTPYLFDEESGRLSAMDAHTGDVIAPSPSMLEDRPPPD